MKKTFLILAMLLSALANAQDITVNKNIKSSPLNLTNVVTNITSSVFNSDAESGGPMGSSLSLQIIADYDSGYGWIQDAILQENSVSGDPFDTEETNTLQILGIQQTKTNEIRLGDLGGVGGSEGKITLPIVIKVNGWSGRMKSHKWTYQILSGRDNVVVKTLDVTIDKVNGWSIQIR